MNLFQISIIAGGAGICLLFSSCAEMQKPLTGGGMLMTPALAPSGFGGGPTSRFHSMHVAAATAGQMRTAQHRAKQALKSPVVTSRVGKERVRYVAVPVNRTKAQVGRGTPVMKVDVTTGVSTGEVFVSDEGGLKEGEKIKLGGDPALYFATTSDKI